MSRAVERHGFVLRSSLIETLAERKQQEKCPWLFPKLYRDAKDPFAETPLKGEFGLRQVKGISKIATCLRGWLGIALGPKSWKSPGGTTSK